MGFVVPPFGEGSLFVQGKDGRVRRLAWTKLDGEEAPTDRRRALPPGSYVVTGYRIIERSKQDVWHVSALGRRIAELEISAGRTAKLALEPSIRIRRGLDGKQVRMTVQGAKDAGLTIYKNGKRIPMRYRLLDEAGRELAQGDIRYG